MQPAPLGWRPAQGRTPPVAAIIVLAIALVVVAVAAVIVLAAWQSFPGVSLSSLMTPICGVFFILLVLLIAAAAGGFGSKRSLPPPPPIQQPMVPAGLQGPIELNCPNCGAPAASVDRFGVAVCVHCNTRFLVR